ncbi:MAG: hypothetical protein O4861_05845 [Trichodesmium sp. St16_bin4-tuft]|nr:hypothetical protein [Trichodesmium sp. St4_bin8_1]MDE5072423.1 hypothetical protein [Trichodesmium sp. St5_bin8]MDE5091221.1 hypothetical protein [Trichodesmium sp. St18_bin3_1_1]MDE5097885.1 hypothetical protein [Trichodesmium sp. St16_bin4-tuft]MDE5104591.1 hypothetical protein [Trichodesmium sp. St19_bin2]
MFKLWWLTAMVVENTVIKILIVPWAKGDKKTEVEVKVTHPHQEPVKLQPT